MSIASVDRELTGFLTTKEPQVIALSGLWGSGKTFYWRSFLATLPQSPIWAKSYSYVSLFGITSLSELKDTLFANAVPLESLVTGSPMLGELSLSPIARTSKQLKALKSKLEQLARKHSTVLERIPKLGEFGPFFRAAAFLTISDSVICIDDLERRSEALALRDVLGLLTMLRDERRCRILVVLNTDALSSEDQAEFQTFREKVFDHEISFNPTAGDCATIAFPPSSRLYELAATYSVRLGISNIRILHRIRRLLDTVAELALDADAAVQQQIVHSSVLLGWCFNSRTGDAPDYEYVKHLNYSRFIDLNGSKEKSPEEERWNSVLAEYDYHTTDELDAALCDVLERGYVDVDALRNILADRSEATRKAKLEAAFHAAWNVYHREFDPDPERLASAFEASMKEGAEVINIMNASATTSLLRSLGYEVLAEELMFYWIRIHEQIDPKALDVENNVWRAEILDARFRAEAQAAFKRGITEPRSFPEVAFGLAKKNGWDNDDIRMLTGASEDDFFELFKSLTGDWTRPVVQACLRFCEFKESSAEYQLICDRARAALIRIAKESKLNQLRVAAYGVHLPLEAPRADT